jgi:hypothetical protein
MRSSLRTYAVLVAILVAVKLLFVAFPTRFPLADQAGAFAWPLVLGIALFGLAGLYVEPRAGFPSMWDARVSNGRRFGLPVLDGFVYGIVTVLVDLGQPADVHLPFPLSIPFYTYGAIFLEILLRLFALTVVTWLLGKVLPKEAAFWIANVLTSWYEPWPQMMEELARATDLQKPGIVIDWILSPLYIGNLVTGYLYRRVGFLGPVVLRLVFYLVWHVAYGGFR